MGNCDREMANPPLESLRMPSVLSSVKCGKGAIACAENTVKLFEEVIPETVGQRKKSVEPQTRVAPKDVNTEVVCDAVV